MSEINDPVSLILEKYEKFGIELGLGRIRAVLSQLGNPQTQVPIIHVAGTNGKGSVCAYLSAILTSAGYQVGRYISPHLVDWTERICLNDVPVSTERLLRSLLEIELICGERALTQFEMVTAAAWQIFAQAGVDIAVIEVGLGGRLDATNVCDCPLVSVITSISLEHRQRLGSTIAKIAFEKAGVIKPHCPVVLGQLPQEAMDVIREKAADAQSPLIQPEPAQWANIPSGHDPDRPAALWAIAQGIPFPLALNGEIQLRNSALAIAVVACLREKGWKISDEAICGGMSNTRWPGRLQWTTWNEIPLLIDGAHNPEAASALRHYMDHLLLERRQAFQVHWIVGMLATKDHREIFEMLLKPGDSLGLVPVSGHASADPNVLEGIAQEVCPTLEDLEIFDSLQSCLSSRSFKQKSDTSLMVLCGSLYLLGAFLQMQSLLKAHQYNPDESRDSEG